MDTVTSLDSWRYMSLNQLSQIFGIARETVKSRIDFYRVPSATEKEGHSRYDAKLVYQAIADYNAMRVDTSDPDKLPPKERRDWYEGNIAKKKDLLASGELVKTIDAHNWMSELVKPGIQLLQTIPDILERDYAIEPQAIADIEQRIDVIRTQWADEIERHVQGSS
jgi:hypothetical protein